jgi:hypothetical protein
LCAAMAKLQAAEESGHPVAAFIVVQRAHGRES